MRFEGCGPRFSKSVVESQRGKDEIEEAGAPLCELSSAKPLLVDDVPGLHYVML